MEHEVSGERGLKGRGELSRLGQNPEELWGRLYWGRCWCQPSWEVDMGGEPRGPNFKSDKSQAEMFTSRKIWALINQLERQLNYETGNGDRDHQY